MALLPVTGEGRRAAGRRARRPAARAAALAALAAVITAGSLALLGSSATGASVAGAWSSAAGALPASDLAGDGPAAGDEAALVGGTACPSPGLCFAVGGYLDSAGNTAGDIETITGTTGGPVSVAHLAAPEPASNPAGDGPQSGGAAHLFAQLFSISCASESFCVAVGTYQDAAGHDWALLETWHGGSTWSPAEV